MSFCYEFSLLLFLVFLLFFVIGVLLGLKYLAASIPVIALAGVAVGIGLIFGLLILSLSRNSIGAINDILIR